MPTSSNIADGPSRGNFSLIEKLGGRRVHLPVGAWHTKSRSSSMRSRVLLTDTAPSCCCERSTGTSSMSKTSAKGLFFLSLSATCQPSLEDGPPQPGLNPGSNNSGGVENNNNPRTQVQNPGLTQEGTRVRTQVQPRFDPGFNQV